MDLGGAFRFLAAESVGENMTQTMRADRLGTNDARVRALAVSKASRRRAANRILRLCD